jgi:hypothetical protein
MTIDTNDAKALPEGVLSLSSTAAGEHGSAVLITLAGDIRPSERTDFVFVLDASPTVQESIRTGEYGRQASAVLQHVLEFDDDGIDFILGSVLSSEPTTQAEVWKAMAAGGAPSAALLSGAHGAADAGQCITADDIQAVLDRPEASSGLASILAPAIRQAREIRKPRGRLFIEIVTDGRVDDLQAVVDEIAAMSQECGTEGEDEARYRIHLLGIGDVDREKLDYLDDGIEDVAPVDIVASTVAADHPKPADTIFKEMKAYMTGGDLGFLSLSASGLVAASLNGKPMEDNGGGEFADSIEEIAVELNLTLTFKETPVPVDLELIVGGLEPIVLTIPTASS